MKNARLLIIWLAWAAILPAQDMLYLHQANGISLGVPMAAIKALGFSADGMAFNLDLGDTNIQYPLVGIDSISFAKATDTIFIDYRNSSVAVINPLAFRGVTINTNGAAVTIRATDAAQNVCYKLSGTAPNGSFKIYSAKKFTLLLNNVNLINQNGPAINIQSSKKVTVKMAPESVNTLTDGPSYCDSIVNEAGDVEKQNAAFFSDGALFFEGNGSLIINGRGANQHGLNSNESIKIDGSRITVSGAAKDGIHADEGVIISNGTVNITASGDAIDGGKGYIAISGGNITVKNTNAGGSGLACDSTLVFTAGTINLTISGDRSKGLRSGKYMVLNGGTISINTSGNVVLESIGTGYDPAYCTGIKCDSLLIINGADISITSSGKGGKGIASDADIRILGGKVNISTSGAGATYKNANGVTDAYSATGLTADGNIEILGGTCILRSTGSAGKGLTTNGKLTIGDGSNTPTISITTSGNKILISGSGMNANYAEAKAISCDGTVTINSGAVTISSADDGIKSNSSVTINGGSVTITQSVEGIESPNITINDGKVSVIASDDGLNATKGYGGEGNDGSCLYLNGGNVVVNSSNGDALDSNGNIVMTGGTVVAHGPTSQPEVGTDYNGTFNISGGMLLITGPNSGNMIEATNTTSSQYAVKVTFSSWLNSSTLFHIQDASGNNLVTYKPVRNLYYIVFSSPALKSGATYSIYTGGSSTGTFQDGLYIGGTYSGGTLRKTITITNKVTSVSL